MSRIKAIVPQVFGNSTTETAWALPCSSPGAGVSLPAPGQGIWVTFEGGDPEYPVWSGVWESTEQTIPSLAKLVTTLNADVITIDMLLGANGVNAGIGLGIFNVKAYGAVGNGVTDDTAAIQRAITACVAAGGGIVWFPAGIYVCNGPYTPQQHTGEIIFQGAGMYATTLLATTGVNEVLKVQMPCEVWDMTVDAGAIAVNGLGLYNYQSLGVIDHMNVRRVRCRNINTSTGIWTLVVWDTSTNSDLFGIQSRRINRCVLEDVVLEGPTNTANDGFAISSVNECFVRGMQIRNIYRTPNFYSINYLHIDGLEVSSCTGNGLVIDAYVYSADIKGLHHDSSSVAEINCQNGQFTNCTFDTYPNLNVGNLFPMATYTFDNCQVTGGIGVEYPIKSLTFTGGRIIPNSASGATAAIVDFSPVDKTDAHPSINATSHTLSTTTGSFFVTGDVGRIVTVDGAGINGSQLVTTITAYGSGTSVTVADAASTSVLNPGITGAMYVGAHPNITVTGTVLDFNPATTGHLMQSFNGSAVLSGGIINCPVLGRPGALSLWASPRLFTIRGVTGFNPVGSAIPGTAFAIGASGVPTHNYTGVDGVIYVTGLGTVTAVSINGVAVSGTLSRDSSFPLKSGGTLTITYSVAPTLVFVGD
jgi:hypothetical protein